MQQIITITPDGGISGLQRKKGKGLDLRQFGHAEIERVSEITWNEDRQRWQVYIINGPFTGTLLSQDHLIEYGVDLGERVWGNDIDDPSWPLMFDDYDDAVAAEVAFLDALRVRGIF